MFTRLSADAALIQGRSLFEGGAYLKIITFLKNDNKEVLNVKNVTHCLALVGKTPRHGAYSDFQCAKMWRLFGDGA